MTYEKVQAEKLSIRKIDELKDDLKLWGEFWETVGIEEFTDFFEKEERNFDNLKLFVNGVKDYYRRIAPNKEHRYLYPRGAIEDAIFRGDTVLSDYVISQMEGNETDKAALSRHILSFTLMDPEGPIVHAGSGWEIHSRFAANIIEAKTSGKWDIINLDISRPVLNWARDTNIRLGTTPHQFEVQGTVNNYPLPSATAKFGFSGVFTHGTLRYWVPGDEDLDRLSELNAKSSADTLTREESVELSKLQAFRDATSCFIKESERILNPGAHIVACDVGWDVFPGPERLIRELENFGYTPSGQVEPSQLSPKSYMVERVDIKAFPAAQFYFLYAYATPEEFSMVSESKLGTDKLSPPPNRTQDLLVRWVEEEVIKANPLVTQGSDEFKTLKLDLLGRVVGQVDRTLVIVNART